MNHTEETSNEKIIRLSIGYALWIISATMTVGLYLELADSSLLSIIIFLAVAITLECTKILLWRSHSGISRALGILLVLLSLFASFGESVVVLTESEQRTEESARARLSATPQYQTVLEDIKSYEMQISERLNRVAKYPANYYSLARQDLNAIDVLREEKTKSLQELRDLETASAENEGAHSMFPIVARFMHIDENWLRLIVSMVVALCIEVGAILLTKRDCIQSVNKTPRSKKIMRYPTVGHDHELTDIEKQFIKAAQDDSSYPFLCGRDKTAKKLGLSCYDAKKIVQALIDKGFVEVKQRRLLLIQAERTRIA